MISTVQKPISVNFGASPMLTDMQSGQTQAAPAQTAGAITPAQGTETAQGGSAFGAAFADTLKTALTGAGVGGAMGLGFSLFPAPKNIIINQMGDVFKSAENGEIVSEGIKNLTKKTEFEAILKDTTLSISDKAKKYIENAAKNDELLQIVKKSAKRMNRTSLLGSGILLGAAGCLLYKLVSGLIPQNSAK